LNFSTPVQMQTSTKLVSERTVGIGHPMAPKASLVNMKSWKYTWKDQYLFSSQIGYLLLKKPTITIKDFYNSLTFSPTFEHSIRMFTCYSPPKLSFHFYLSACDRVMWVSIVLSGVILASFLNLHVYFNISRNFFLCVIIFYFSIFVEESYSVPSKLNNN